MQSPISSQPPQSVMTFARLLLPLVVGAASLIPSLVAAPAQAHALWTSPTPRSNSDSLKDPYGPCGNVARTGNPTMFTAGQTLNVTWKETITHPGCFMVDFSTGGDQNWTLLTTIAHSNAGATPRNYSAQVTLPAGVGCTDCTLRLRQLMLGAETDPCPPTSIAMGATYYSCADVTIPAPSAPDMAQTPMPDLGMTAPPAEMESGCSMATPRSAPLSSGLGGLGGGLGALLLAAFATLQLTLGRRRSSSIR